MQILNQISKDFEAYLSDLSFRKEPIELYDPIQYIMGIGGKRLRPAVLLLTCYLFEGKYQRGLSAALAVEIFHNFTLVHDDIMDEAPLRRGQPTVHQKYNLNTGILSGDVMLVLAYKFLTENTPAHQLPKVLQVFNQFAVEVCEGQQMDMNFERKDKVTIDEYIRMIELKTSVLVAGAMQIGALLGGAKEKEAEAMYQFGRNLGIAFQLQDDLLDTYGDPEKFGKKIGGDIAQNKKTILYLKAIERALPHQHQQLELLYQSNRVKEQDKIKKVIEIFGELNVKDQVIELQEIYKNNAFKHLNSLDIPPERRGVMELFANNLMRREL